MKQLWWGAAAAALTLLPPTTASAQAGADTLVAAGSEYQIESGFGRLLFGTRYRSLWATPVAAPALTVDLGLTDSADPDGPVWLWTPDGALWEYHPLDRNLVATAPPTIRDNLLPSVIQGLNPVRHPGAAPVVESLGAALGIDVPASMLVRLADSASAPGGGRLGYLVAADTAGNTTVEVLDSLRAGGGRDVDARAYLRERLFDTWLGEWDVAPEQWRWKRDDATARWTPAPRYRQFAFARFDGQLARFAGEYFPGFVRFGTKYQKQLGVTPYQRTLDRQLLALLDWPVWDSMAVEMEGALTDGVIDAAVGRLPLEYHDSAAAPLAAALRARRDRLPQAARELYLLVNRESAFFGTTGPDTVRVTRTDGGGLELTFAGGFHRRYAPGETRAVALYLGGGADQVALAGPGGTGPLLDIAWTPGLEVTGARRSGERVLFYGGRPDTDELRVRSVPDTLPVPGVQNLDLSDPPPVLLHSTKVSPVRWLDANSDIGLLLGGGVALTDYRIGHSPFYRKLLLRAAYATGLSQVAVELHAEFHRWHSPVTFTVDAGIPAITDLRFFGYGNTTASTESANYYQTSQRVIYVYPAWHYRLGRRSELAIGPIFKQVGTDTTQNDFISESRPYGVPDFAQFGVDATATLDTRDAPSFSRSGWHATAGASYYPFVFGSGDPFGSVQGSVATYLTPDASSPLTLALRASGRLTFGEVPVHEAAYVGGSNTLRGYQSGRYAGDAAAWFNSELRAELGTVAFIAPWRFGVLGIGDVGRVFYDTDNANVWHAGAGGGIWMALPDRSMGLVVTAAFSDQGSAFWFGSGFMF